MISLKILTEASELADLPPNQKAPVVGILMTGAKKGDHRLQLTLLDHYIIFPRLSDSLMSDIPPDTEIWILIEKFLTAGDFYFLHASEMEMMVLKGINLEQERTDSNDRSWLSQMHGFQ